MRGDLLDIREQRKYKEAIERKIEDLRHRLAQPDDTTTPVAPDNAIGRLSRVDAMQVQQMALEMRRRLIGQLARLELALRLIEEGEYGTCNSCDEDIAAKRLEVYPDARLCVACAERLERGST